MNSSKVHNTVIPQGEQRCVWMTAGIVSYQLCDKEFDCDHCPIDAAMKNQIKKEPTQKGKYIGLIQKLPEELLYSQNHCWLKVIDSTTVQIGIEPELASMFHMPKAVILPFSGAQIRQRESCLWIVMEGGALPFSSPLDGTVIAINRRVVDDPLLLSHQKSDGLWLFTLKVDPSAVANGHFWNVDEAQRQYDFDLAELKELLTSSSHHEHDIIGTTLADGGELLQNVVDTIGNRDYFLTLQNYFARKNR